MSTKTLGQFKITKTLGRGGSCKVKLAEDADGNKYAMKIMNPDMDHEMRQLVINEVNALQALGAHANIIQIYECQQGIYEKVKPNGEKIQREVDYMILELGQGGELFDFIAISGGFKERYARYFFRQFMTGLDHCHRKGVAHRDLKPENLLLDENHKLKIADFGFAAPVEGKDGGGYLHTGLGTLNYMAPEIHAKQPYQPRPVDLFASAVILFIMVAQHPPFTTAQPADHYYKLIAQNRADWFWKLVCNGKEHGEDSFSKEFKDLIQSMIQLNSNHRPTMSEILTHPWMQGDTATEEEVKQEFDYRQELVKQQLEADRQQKEAEKKIQQAQYKNALMKSGNVVRSDGRDEDLDAMEPTKALEDYEHLFKQTTSFFSSCNPDIIEEALKTYLQDKVKGELSDLKVNDKKYKLSFKLTTQGQSEVVHVTNIQVKVLRTQNEDAKYCVEFQKLSGDQHSFHTHFGDIVKNALNFSNDSIFAE